MPRVSVIIPTYNSAHFLGQAIESVLEQTYRDWELIVVDDGSVDNTPDVVAHYDHHNMRYCRQENKGPSSARNVGIRASSGDLLAFLDADDVILPQKLAFQVAMLDEHPEFELVYSAWQYVDESGTRILSEMRPNKQGHLLKDLLLCKFFFVPGAAIVRHNCLAQVGLFDESLAAAEDIDLWIRIALAGYVFGYVDEPLLRYRLVRGSLSHRLANHARSELARLDKFFANPELPEDIKTLKPEAHAAIHYEYGAKYYGAGDVERGREHIRKAVATCPALARDRDWLLDWIAGYALGPDIDDPERFIDFTFDNLPLEATTLRALRRRARGRYHTAAAFSAYQNHHLEKIRGHILPALWGDPTIVRNRGFVSIAVRSLFA